MWSRLALSDGNQWASVGECSSRTHVVTLQCTGHVVLPPHYQTVTCWRTRMHQAVDCLTSMHVAYTVYCTKIIGQAMHAEMQASN